MNSSMRHVAVGIRGPGVVVWLTATLLVLAALTWGLPARAAQTLAVTSTVDDTNPANYACPATTLPCTLRLAIETANSETSPPDTISVPAGTYLLTRDTELQIRTAMNIVGADPRTTIIDGDNGGNRIFNILPNPIDVGISNLTLQNAFLTGSNDGGALLNQSTGTVTLDNDAIVSNRVQDVQNAGPSFGGGIYNGSEGTTHLKITRSLIAGNTAMEGTDTTSPSEGGGIFNTSQLSITNTTMTANTATGGGAIFNFGTAALVNDTIAGNFGGLDATGAPGGGGLTGELPTSYTLTNTIVSGNTHGDCRKWQGSGTFISTGHNIDGDGTCFLTDPTDKPSTDPHLAALALNSPGQTQTMAIDSASAAYNAAGATACPATDQRGVSRPQGSACDIGAYELVVLAASPSPSPTPAASPSPSPIPALPKAGSAGSPGAGSQVGLLLGVTALLLAPLAVALARRRHPDDNPVA